MKKELLIIGGGIAGLSAAVHAIRHDLHPIILEKNRYLGGRVRSFHAADIRQTIDNGQHVLSAAYTETRDFLRQIGSDRHMDFPANFTARFMQPGGKTFQFRTYSLPAPFHFFVPLLVNRKFTTTPPREYFRFVYRNLKLPPQKRRQMTADQWLTYCGQNSAIRQILWEPLTYSILNTGIREASAELLYQAIRQSFLHSRQRSALGIPLDWLSEILAHPAEKFITGHGGSIYLLNPVTKFVRRDDRIQSVVTRKQQFDAPWVIAAVPPFALTAIAGDSAIPALTEALTSLEKFEYNPIITIHIFLRSELPSRFPLAISRSPLQWIFSHPGRKTPGNLYGYALVISAAEEWAARPQEEILQMAVNELQRLFASVAAPELRPVKYKIIKEKRATIKQTPASLAWRPPADTPLQNLFLAGDWTDTGLPATIEGAVKSGRTAVERIVRKVHG